MLVLDWDAASMVYQSAYYSSLWLGRAEGNSPMIPCDVSGRKSPPKSAS